MMSELLAEKINWNDDGLVAAIAQEKDTGNILMMAWMNAESLALTLEHGEAFYWSRSRQALWHKGESSGHTQRIFSVHLDCDGDALLLEVEQQNGIACHTGRHSCFFWRYQDGQWVDSLPVLKDPETIYK